MNGGHADRLLRVRILESLELRARQFKSYESIWPFRIPHEPLTLAPIVEDALADEPGGPRAGSAITIRELLRSRTVLQMRWEDGHVWTSWAIALPSGILLYCDDDGDEARLLASVKRGNPLEADGFFLELLAETHGQAFGMALAGSAPDQVRTSIADRDFLADVFVELFEGTDAESAIVTSARQPGHARLESDFRADVERWLARTLVAPPAGRTARRQPRRRDADPTA
ncbi:MAG TPA: hypothetical protein VH458_10470 [Vicinamibacterales bacterium]|jgi:hypothetical protein